MRDAEGNTPLHDAAKLGSSDAARYLLQASADARALNARGHLPHDAATTPSFALANELLQVGLLRFSEFGRRARTSRLRRLLLNTKPRCVHVHLSLSRLSRSLALSRARALSLSACV